MLSSVTGKIGRNRVDGGLVNFRLLWGEVAKASGGDSFHVALQDRSIAWLVSPFGVLRS